MCLCVPAYVLNLRQKYKLRINHFHFTKINSIIKSANSLSF